MRKLPCSILHPICEKKHMVFYCCWKNLHFLLRKWYLKRCIFYVPNKVSSSRASWHVPWPTYIRGFTKFGIKVAWRLQFLEYLKTLSLKFQKARTKIEVVLALPCWLSQLNWDSQQGRLRTTSILVRAFWNFKLLRSSNTPETVAFTPPWYQTWWNP